MDCHIAQTTCSKCSFSNLNYYTTYNSIFSCLVSEKNSLTNKDWKKICQNKNIHKSKYGLTESRIWMAL